MRRFLVAFLVLACAVGLVTQSAPERESSWNAFIAWWRTAPVAANPFADYAAKLRSDGKADDEVKKEVGLVASLAAERSDWVGIYFDKVYARPLTGDPAKDGFNAQPSALLVDSIKGLKPGVALDAGVGQGRNAVYLAQQGWTVTGFDVSGEALAVTAANAQKAGVRVATIKASYEPSTSARTDGTSSCWRLRGPRLSTPRSWPGSAHHCGLAAGSSSSTSS